MAAAASFSKKIERSQSGNCQSATATLPTQQRPPRPLLVLCLCARRRLASRGLQARGHGARRRARPHTTHSQIRQRCIIGECSTGMSGIWHATIRNGRRRLANSAGTNHTRTYQAGCSRRPVNSRARCFAPNGGPRRKGERTHARTCSAYRTPQYQCTHSSCSARG